MLNDHQTIGGYPKCGALTRRSAELLGQAMTGDLVRFHWCDAAQALLQERQRLQQLQQQLDMLSAQWAAVITAGGQHD